MKRRSPWLMYVGVLASAGLFAFVWLILLMRDVNQLERRTAFPAKSLTVFLSLGLPAYYLAVFFLPFPVAEPSTTRQVCLALIFVFAIALILLMFISLVRLSLHVTRALGYTSHAMHATLIVVLTLLSLISFVILQRRINILIERSLVQR